MSETDYVIVGSGINSLVAAAMLGRRGRRVVVLERNDRIGGTIRTDRDLTAPGFVHDTMATTFVLFLLSPAYAALAKDLEARGLAFSHTDTPTAVLRPDGSTMVLSTDRARNVAAFEAGAAGDGAAFARTMDAVGADAPFLFALLGGRLWSAETARLVLGQAWRRGPRWLAAWFGEALGTARAHLETTYAGEGARALLAPWVLHTGLGPESAYSGQMAKVIAFAIEAAGCPIVTGGADRALAAFERLIVDQGGTIHTGTDVERIVRGPGDRAAGVRLADGTRIEARRGVICSVTPRQLYGRLLAGDPLPDDVATGLKGWRLGKGNMQVHYALDRPPRWRAEGLEKVALIHLTDGLDAVSRAANEAERGLLPAEPTICVGQPAALDRSRAPEGRSVLWIQLPEAPRHIRGDAAGVIDPPAGGVWTDDVRERFADRVEDHLARHVEGFRETVVARRAMSPSDLSALNVNLEEGDPYGGWCGLDQFFLWRPFKGSVNHRTHVPGLWHIGASTHPGPGLGGGSGFLVASRLP